MTQKKPEKDQIDKEQPPSGILPEDWVNTPLSVRELVITLRKTVTSIREDWSNTPTSLRKLVKSLLDAIQERSADPQNRFPILVTILINLAIVAGLANYFEGKFALPCINPPQVSSLALAVILLISFHFLWRNIYAIIPPGLAEPIQVWDLKIPLSVLVTFFNEMQVWKLPSRLLGLLLIILIVAGVFLNFSPASPFYIRDELSAIQGFSIQRFYTDLVEGVPIGGTLSIATNEKVFVEAVFRNKAGTTCTWYSKMSTQAPQTGCFIVLDEVSRIGRDTLTVRIQSACGTQDFVGLHVVVQP
jgi:hypothetical protein